MKEIPITKGRVALVDDEDYAAIAQWKWGIFTGNGQAYAVRAERANNRRHYIRMHHLVLPKKPGFMIDHINGNSLDNRRSNLRYATAAQNSQNRPGNTLHNRSSQYKGVSHRPSPCASPWQADILAFGKRTYLGVYATEIEAARAYDAAARIHHGEFARLNFPDVPDGKRAEYAAHEVEAYRAWVKA